LIHVISKFERPSKDLINQYRSLSSATVHEAYGRKGAVNCQIKPIAKGLRICGPAFTVYCHPGDNLMLHKALEKAEPGDVLVASVGGLAEAGYFGALMSTSAVTRKLGGLAIDGCIRDTAEIISMGFPIFSRGSCILGTPKAAPGLINHPIIFGDVWVEPGDIVLGDDDGIVIVNQAESKTVLEKSIQRIKNEKIKTAQLKKGVSSFTLNKLDKVFESLGIIEE
jgi:4-hydroxy-4-methyl-2-oxoglutarate aldolase